MLRHVAHLVQAAQPYRTHHRSGARARAVLFSGNGRGDHRVLPQLAHSEAAVQRLMELDRSAACDSARSAASSYRRVSGSVPCRGRVRRCGRLPAAVAEARISACTRCRLSSGLRVPRVDARTEELLRPFDDRVYLHQVVERNTDGLNRYLDLADALLRCRGRPRRARMAGALPRAGVSRRSGTVRFHAGFIRDALAAASPEPDYRASGSRDLHLERAAGAVSRRCDGSRHRARAELAEGEHLYDFRAGRSRCGWGAFQLADRVEQRARGRDARGRRGLRCRVCRCCS